MKRSWRWSWKWRRSCGGRESPLWPSRGETRSPPCPSYRTRKEERWGRAGCWWRWRCRSASSCSPKTSLQPRNVNFETRSNPTLPSCCAPSRRRKRTEPSISWRSTNFHHHQRRTRRPERFPIGCSRRRWTWWRVARRRRGWPLEKFSGSSRVWWLPSRSSWCRRWVRSSFWRSSTCPRPPPCRAARRWRRRGRGKSSTTGSLRRTSGEPAADWSVVERSFWRAFRVRLAAFRGNSSTCSRWPFK